MEDDPFYVSPKDANSRGDCPHEIGSDAWLEWQRQFAWEEYTKPSGQERVEAAYQRLQARGFKIAQQLPQPGSSYHYPTLNNSIRNEHRVLFITKEYAFFHMNVKEEYLNRSHLVLSKLNSPRYSKWDDDLTISPTAMVTTQEFQLYFLRQNSIVAIEYPVSYSPLLYALDKYFSDGNEKRLYDSLQDVKEHGH